MIDICLSMSTIFSFFVFNIGLPLNKMALNKADCNLRQIDFAHVQNEVETTIQSKKKRGTCCLHT